MAPPYSNNRPAKRQQRANKNYKKMEYSKLERMIDQQEGVLARSQAFPSLMRKVYVWMSLALAITALTAYGVASSPSLLTAIFSSKIAFFGLIIAELGLVIWLSARIGKLSLTSATMLFILYSVINGATLSSIFVAYSPMVIAKTFLITAGTFAATAFVGYTTRRDLSRMGGIFTMALIGLIIASVVNIFLGSSLMDTIISYIGVAIFVGLTAWDSQAIKRMLLEAEDGGEMYQKVALMGSLSLYLDFINLFLYLLRIFGRNND